jgi:hypothetical protein
MVALRMPPALIATVEGWAAAQHDEPVRSEAIRRLIELGLTVRAKTNRHLSEKQKRLAREMAAKAIDGMTDSDVAGGSGRLIISSPSVRSRPKNA